MMPPQSMQSTQGGQAPSPPAQGGQLPVQQNPAQIAAQHKIQIQQHFAQQIAQVEQTITIDRVLKFLRDERLRSFAIEIETDSTIMPDEAAEKQSRNEFLGAFSQATAGVQQLLQLGPSGAELAGGLLKFALAPYRVGRQLDGLIEKFTEQAPQIIQQQMQAQQGGGQSQELAQAQMQLAQAEQQKAQAQAAKVQADAQLKAQQLQLDMAKAQSDATHRQQTMAMEAKRLSLEIQQAQADLSETVARVEHVKAETIALIANAQTARQSADNDTARAAAETGLQAIEAAQSIMPPVQYHGGM